MPNPMSNSKPLLTFYDLASTEVIAEPTSIIDMDSELQNDETLQNEVYEQLAELDYIYVEKTNTEDNFLLTRQEPISLADVFEGLAQLATMGVVEVTDIVEAIHREIILRPIGRFNERSLTKWQRGITGRIYGTVRYVASVVGNNLTTGLWLYNNMTKKKTFNRYPKA